MVTDDWAEDMKNIMGGGMSLCFHIWTTSFVNHFADANDDDDHMHLLFSATFPKEARALAKAYMAKDHVRIRVGRTGSTHLNVMQRVGSMCCI